MEVFSNFYGWASIVSIMTGILGRVTDIITKLHESGVLHGNTTAFGVAEPIE